jgi:hypothetical protein
MNWSIPRRTSSRPERNGSTTPRLAARVPGPRWGGVGGIFTSGFGNTPGLPVGGLRGRVVVPAHRLWVRRG